MANKGMFRDIAIIFCLLAIFVAAQSRAYEARAYEARADEARADETRADETREDASATAVKTLKILRLPGEVQIDGVLNEPCYKQHKPLADFCIAADAKNPAPLTRAWVFWREDKLVLAFRCEDDKIVAAPKSDEEMDVDRQDRVELFIWNGRPQDAYLCLELAPRGAVLDYSARFYRRIDTSWNAEGLKVATVITPKGYNTEAELPAAAAREFGIKFAKGSSFRGGLFRGNSTSGEKGENIMWITWVESGKKKPDFHIAESFGRFVLVD